jgi:hypothetical protein
MLVQANQQQVFDPKVPPFLSTFNLDPQYFDPKGDKDFSVLNPQGKKRGSFPYYPPYLFKRFGLNVSGRYDNGNDRWLEKNGNPGEWAVAYHGVRCPKASSINGGRCALNLIMDGLEKG